MSKIVLFLKDSYQELVHKVSWPGYKSLQSNAILVLIASLIFAGIIWIIDRIVENGLQFYYESF